MIDQQYLKQPQTPGKGWVWPCPNKAVFPKHTSVSSLVQFFLQRPPSPLIKLQLPPLQTSNYTRPPGPSSDVGSLQPSLSCYYDQFLVGALLVISNYLFSLIIIEDSLTGRVVNADQGCLNVRTETNAPWFCRFVPYGTKPHPTRPCVKTQAKIKTAHENAIGSEFGSP